jgi:glycosyltransferase involved in cell wall biosynthesis
MAENAGGPRRLAVTTPWHPSLQRPFAGSFVQAATAAVARRFERVDLYHTEDWTGPAHPSQAGLVRKAYDRLTAGPQRRIVSRERMTPDGYWATDIPTPVTPRRDYADWAASHENALRHVIQQRRLPGERFDADVVHGHVGIYGGWLALRFARPDARIVVTEHASFLGKILGQPRSRAMYAEVMQRADAVLCVSGGLRLQLVEAFPEHAAKIEVLPNAVDIESMPRRATPVRELHRWIYIGKVIALKGVAELLEAFAIAAKDEAALRLTILGDGVLVDQLKARAAQLGVGERVAFHDAVPPERVFEFLHGHDLLVHASKSETFGMTTVEAVAAGMPVLVTKCGGPQETLAGLDGVAGLLVDVSDDPAVIVDGYRRLAEAHARGEIDPGHAREVLIGRFGSAAVAERLMDVYSGRGTGEEESVSSPRGLSADAVGTDRAADASPGTGAGTGTTTKERV